MPWCSLLSFISKVKFLYDKYSVDKVWTNICCHFYFRGITLTNWIWLHLAWSVLFSTTIRVVIVDKMWGTAGWVHNKFWPLWWRVSLSITVQTTLTDQIWVVVVFFFFTAISTSKKLVFFRTRAMWNIDASSVVWFFIDNGKLANQIARLVAIAVKSFASRVSSWGNTAYFFVRVFT